MTCRPKTQVAELAGDRVAIGAHLGKHAGCDEAIADFAAAYADPNDKDHALLRHAIDDGGIPAPDGMYAFRGPVELRCAPAGSYPGTRVKCPGNAPV